MSPPFLAAMGYGFGDAIVVFLVALAASIVGGAIGGVIVGGKDLGQQAAAMIGSFFGPSAVVPGIIVGIVLVVFVGL